MRYLLPMIIVLFASAAAAADTLEVPSEYATIQAAIDAAAPGDIVLVAAGTYVENINFLGKAIVVESADGAASTVIDGSQPIDPDRGSVVVFENLEGNDSVIRGFTLTGGTGSNFETPCDFGAGICCWTDTSPTIEHNIIKDNAVVGLGGGIYAHAAPVIRDNVIDGNTAPNGGGLYFIEGQPVVQDNQIRNNSASLGGGIFCDGAYRILDNFFEENTAGGGAAIYSGVLFKKRKSGTSSESGGAGEGLIQGNTFLRNEASDFGGGIECFDDAPDILGNTFLDNWAGRDGGAMFLDIWYGAQSFLVEGNILRENVAELIGGGIYLVTRYDVLFVNNTISRNKAGTLGGGLYAYGIGNFAMTFTNNTLSLNTANQGGGLHISNNVTTTIENSIFWNDSAPVGREIFISDTTVDIAYSDMKGGQASVHVASGTLNWGGGMIDAYPWFVSTMDGDYHLTYDSPCMDTGDSGAAGLPDFDFEGDPRDHLAGVDMGADEFHNHIYCTGDFTPGGDIKGNLIGLPGSTPVGLFLGFELLDPPLNHQWGAFHLASPWYLFGPLFPIPVNGVLTLSATLPSTPPGPYDLYFQGLIGYELTNLFTLTVW